MKNIIHREQHRELQMVKYSRAYTSGKSITVPLTATITNPNNPPIAYPTIANSTNFVSALSAYRFSDDIFELQGLTPNFIYRNETEAIIEISAFYDFEITSGEDFNLILLRSSESTPNALITNGAETVMALSSRNTSVNFCALALPGDLFRWVFIKGRTSVNPTDIDLHNFSMVIKRLKDYV